MIGLSVFAVFLVALFVIACLIVMLIPDQYFTARRVLTCPETRQPVDVRIALSDRIRTLLAGKERLHLRSCSRWPDRQMCGQECLLQVDLNPQLLDRVLRAWADGKGCAICRRSLSAADWRLGRFAGLDAVGNLVPGGEMRLRDLPMDLEKYRPVCWHCHSAWTKQRVPSALLKGDRRGGREQLWTGE